MGLRFLRYWYLGYLSKPAVDRPIYRVIRKSRRAKVLEIGMGLAIRSTRMIELAQESSGKQVEYTGVDLFETRGDSDPGHLTLKQAYRLLQRTGASIRLMPGDAYGALAELANKIGPQDLIVISADSNAESLQRAWFYIPRILHPKSLVVLEEKTAGRSAFKAISRTQITNWSREATRRRAA